MSDAQQLVNISAPRGKTAAQCERQFVCAAISIVVAENSFMKKILKLTAMLGLAVLMIVKSLPTPTPLSLARMTLRRCALLRL
jgi:hypothetical protein